MIYTLLLCNLNRIFLTSSLRHPIPKFIIKRGSITILIGFHFGTFRNFKHYYLFYVQKHFHSSLSTSDSNK
ncbi:hypothetical protein EZS27_028837 [termite gut metagenome]|uniref:Uncharacterized protein n=1 Tax=termite gut metagenome TaxID=433724 RepID=A0A5J4QKL8_9ZZZZ